MTVLNKGALAVIVRGSRIPSYEGSEDIAFDCSASGAPGDNPQYAYAWTARGDTQDTALLSATDIASPVFYVPDEVWTLRQRTNTCLRQAPRMQRMRFG